MTDIYVPQRVGEGYFIDWQPPVAGDDLVAWAWDNVAGKYVPLVAPKITSFVNAAHTHQNAAGGAQLDHGLAMVGLSDDDHTGYLLATGARTGASSQAQAFTNGIVGPSWKPPVDSTSALQLQNAAGAPFVYGDTTNLRVGIGIIPLVDLHVFRGANASTDFRLHNNDGGTAARALIDIRADVASMKYYVFSSGYAASGIFAANRAVLDANGAGGFYVGASNVAGTFNVLTGGLAGANVRMAIDAVGLSTLTANDAVTSAISNVLTVIHNSTGTPAAGFGNGIALQLESSTTTGQGAGRIAALWNVATHASRVADLVFYANNQATEREFLRGRGGAAAEIGVLGAAPVARQTVTGSRTDGTALASLLTALATFGWITDSSTA